MQNLKDKVEIALIYICFLAIILLLLCIYPYKEVLECNGNACNVERFYVLFSDRSDKYYSFNKMDDIQVSSHHSSGRRGVSYYEIENFSDYNFNIFENCFAGSGTPKKLVQKIKSNDTHIKIIKYWLGHKIEK